MPDLRVALIVAVLSAIVFAYQRYRQSSGGPGRMKPMSDPNILMPIMAQTAVKFAADHDIPLDFSPASVEAAESLLGQMHDAYARGELSDAVVHERATQFGAYIGEVLQRAFGGAWVKDHSVFGPSTYRIHCNGDDSFPIGWCEKRILNGNVDNVWITFQASTSGKVRVRKYFADDEEDNT